MWPLIGKLLASLAFGLLKSFMLLAAGARWARARQAEKGLEQSLESEERRAEIARLDHDALVERLRPWIRK